MNSSPYSRRKFIKALGLGAASLVVPGCSHATRRRTAGLLDKKPNIIFILADDLGWAELGCYANTFNETASA